MSTIERHFDYASKPRVSKKRFLQVNAVSVALAKNGPRNKTNVCNPVPNPIEEATPRPIHHPYQRRALSIGEIYLKSCKNLDDDIIPFF